MAYYYSASSNLFGLDMSGGCSDKWNGWIKHIIFSFVQLFFAEFQ